MLPTISLLKQAALLSAGIQPLEHKQCSTQRAIQRFPQAERLLIPLQQHAGPAGQLRVTVGQRVRKGEPLTQGVDPLALPVHASSAGWISAILPYPDPNGPRKLQLPPPLCLALTVDRENTEPSYRYSPWPDYEQRPPSHLRQRAYEAGLAGLGGAGFPSTAKWPQQPIQLLIINAVECEPYLTADDSLLREYATGVIQGCHILRHILQARQTVLAIEDNKPQALAALQQAFSALAGDWLQFRQLPTRYPSGDARQLIRLLTGHSVPPGQHSSQLGVVVHNVATLFALQQAVTEGRPLIERVVTVTGEAISQPSNYWVPLGTPMNYLLQQAGLADSHSVTITVGGPLMGRPLDNLQAPVIKTTSCLLVRPLNQQAAEQPCIRCGECASVCPVNLLPQQLYWYSRGQQHEAARAHHLMACIECAACNSVCPSNIPLVHYFQQAKSQLSQQDQQTQQARQAKMRFEARQQRLAQQQQQRRVAMNIPAVPPNPAPPVTPIDSKRVTGSNHPTPSSASAAGADRQAAVAAALARAQARKQAALAATNPTSGGSPNVPTPFEPPDRAQW